MNFTGRNAELDKARAVQEQIAQAEARLDATDDEEGTLKDELQEARREFQSLIKAGERTPRVGELNDSINEIQDHLQAIARVPSTLQNTFRRLGSDLEGFRARDWWWLKTWRDRPRGA